MPIDGYYVMATFLLTGEQRTEYSQQIEPLRAFDPSGRWRRRGLGNGARVDRVGVGQQAFSGETPLASNTGITNRSSNEALEETTGVNWYLTKWSRAEARRGTRQLRRPRADREHEERLTEEDTLYTRFQVIF